MNIGEWVPEDAWKGALEAGAWMAAHPEQFAEGVERHRKCREVYIRELETGKRIEDPPEGYAKYVKYMGRIVRAEWEADTAAREAELAERRAKRTIVLRTLGSAVIGVATVVAAIAGVAALILQLTA